jgi:molybdate transport system substrate-binding protein
VRKLMRLWVPGVVVLGLVAAGCGSDSSSGSSAKSTTTTATAKVTGAITVSAAASLTEAFTKIGTDFKRANPNATATFNFGSSGTLETQIQQGAPADTFASADLDNMNKLVAASLVDGQPVVFAKNRLVIVTKPGNPKQVKTLADLANLDVVSLCGETVPCGKYAAQILQTAGVTIPEIKVTRGQDVKATLAAVATGDADAAIVYVTDAKSAGSTVEAVTIPDAQNAVATYPIATLTASVNKPTSQAFIAYVMSSKGQATLRSYGFLPPS